MPNEKYEQVSKMLEDGIKSVFTSERYINYLKFAEKFHRYSSRNIMLIMLQNPQATAVAGFNDWKNKHHRYVKKGEKGLNILAPAPYKVNVEVPVYDENHNQIVVAGKPLTEQKTVQKIAFKVVSVFDVSQTDGEPLPQLAPKLTAAVESYPDLFSAISNISDFSINFIDIPGSVNGYCDFKNKEIKIDNGMSEAQNIKTLIHEVARSRLHEPNTDITYSAAEKEVQAESIAFIVANHFGIDTSEFSFDYIASWSSGKELTELSASLDIIQKEASAMIQGIEEQYQQLIKDRNVEINNAEKGVDRDADGIEDSRDSSYTAPPVDLALQIAELEAKIAEAEKYNNDYEIAIAYTEDTHQADAMREELAIYENEVLDMKTTLNELKNAEKGVDRDADGIEDSRDSSYTAPPVDLALQIAELEAKIAEAEKYNNDYEIAIAYTEDTHQADAMREELAIYENEVLDMKTTLNELKNAEKDVNRDMDVINNSNTQRPENKTIQQKRYSKEENKRIIFDIKSSIPIQDYAQRIGFTVQKAGSYYTLKEHDSVRIDPRKNRFVQNSTGVKGSIIDFVMHFENLDTAAAIDKLAKYIGADIRHAPIPVQQQSKSADIEKKTLVLPEKAKSMRNVFAYLINTRKIDSQIVSQWVKNRNLYQDTHNNCVFVTYNEDGKPEFASQRGTNTKHKFRADVVGSNYDTCHFINNHAKSLVISEAVIDIMSVQTILKANGRDINNYNYLSLNGTSKTHAVLNALQKSNTDTVVLATDNDNAGKEARNALRTMISDFDKNIKVVDYVPQNQKDWNAELVANVQNEEQKLQNQNLKPSLSEKISDCQRKADNLNQSIEKKQQHNKDLGVEL